MSLSKSKQEKIELRRRTERINERSINGKGYFMDAGVESYVREFMNSGDDSLLSKIPDYRRNMLSRG